MIRQNKLEKGLSVQSSLAVSQCIGQRGETDGFRYRSNEEERSQEENVAGHDHDGTPRERERESLGGYAEAMASASSLSNGGHPQEEKRQLESILRLDGTMATEGAEHPF